VCSSDLKQLGAVFGFYKESHGQEITELK